MPQRANILPSLPCPALPPTTCPHLPSPALPRPPPPPPAGVLIMESLEHAQARGATIIAEYLGGECGC